MKPSPTFVFLAAAAVAVGGCSTFKTGVDYDKDADFSRYKTFAWKSTGEIRDPIWEKRLRGVMEDQMAVKGFKPAADPDLLVVAHPRLSKETRVDTYNTGWGYGYGYGWGGMATTIVTEIPVGTLIIDLVDARRKELIWRGTASGSLNTDPSRSSEDREQTLRKVVAQLFESYPPGKK